MNNYQSFKSWYPWLIAIGSALLYTVNLNRAPHPDELYHVLAARGYLETGQPTIADGVYDRVFLHTWLVAQLFNIFGESLVVARLASLAPIALLNLLIYMWLARFSNVTAAVIGTVLFAVSPFAFEIAQYTRFYGLQTLFFTVGCLLLYHATYHSSHRASSLVFALVAFSFSLYLQLTTVMGLLALGTWWTLFAALPWYSNWRVEKKTKIKLAVFFSILVLTLLILSLFSGILQESWNIFRNVQVYNQHTKDEFWFYYLRYFLFYPSLWPLIGFIALLAFSKFPRPALFATTIFLVSFSLNSLAATKRMPYIMYAQPFLFMIIGLGISVIWPTLLSGFKHLLRSVKESIPLAPRMQTICATGLIGFAILVAVAGNPFVARTATLMAGITIPPELPEVKWSEAKNVLVPLMEDADVVVTQAELEMLYFLGDYDMLVSPSRMEELEDKRDFELDFRTGRPVIGTMDGLQSLMGCYDKGIFVTNKRRWGRKNMLADELADYIVENSYEVSLPSSSRVIAFAWDETNGELTRDACENLPVF